MRWLLAALLLVVSGSLAHAGELIELTDGTKLTVESHWNDGDQVHLVRGGVTMIVAKSRIKSIDDDVKDPEVYTDRGAPAEPAAAEQPVQAVAAVAAPPTAQAPQQVDPALIEMSASELEALQHQEAKRLRELQEKSFNALHGGTATPQQQRQAEALVAEQNQRAAQVRKALDTSRETEAGAAQPQ